MAIYTFEAYAAAFHPTKSSQSSCMADRRIINGLRDNTFHTTTYIKASYFKDRYALIQHTLLDSGASSNFIRRCVVIMLGLEVVEVPPRTFRGIGGHRVTYDQAVHFELNIGSVVNWIWAYVDDSNSDLYLLIGKAARRQFRMVENGTKGVGAAQQCQITVAVDVARLRNKRFVVPEDQPGVGAAMVL